MAGREMDAGDLIKRFDRVRAYRDSWRDILQDAFELAAPYTDSEYQSTSEGQQRARRRYSSELAVAAKDSSDILHSTITPEFAKFFALEMSPEIEGQIKDASGDAEVIATRATLEKARDIFFDHLNTSNFHVEISSAYLQAQVTTGVLRMDENPDPAAISAFRFSAYPIDSVFPEYGRDGYLHGVWQKHDRMPVRDIVRMWPAISALPQDWTAGLDEDEEVEKDVLEAHLYDPHVATWSHVVIAMDGTMGGSILLEEEEETSPWVLFDSMRAPREHLGRGNALDVLPAAQSHNVIMRDILRAAARAGGGVWQMDDDGVNDPDKVAKMIVPGAVIQKAVGSAGLTPLEEPAVRSFSFLVEVLRDLAEKIRYGVVGPEMPPLEGSRMTATEVERRVQQFNLIRSPRLTRYFHQVVQCGIVPRGMNILRRRGAIKADLWRGESGIKVVAAGPYARMQALAEASDALQGYAMARQVHPDGTEEAAPGADFAAWLLEKTAFPAALIRDKQARDAAREQRQQSAELAAMAEAAGKAAPAVKAVTDSPEAMRAIEGGGEPSLEEMMR